MCGITGIYAFNQIGSFYMVNLAKSVELLSKRGPDGRGTYIEDFLALGHRRLSIIDTSYLGKQPMEDESGRYVIVFNGEIFNYRELKSRLAVEGVTFTSECDTEVLLKLYIAQGKDCVKELVGFFAFAIYDKETKEMFIARDRMGIKPLLYYYDDDKFVFASELKSLLAYNIPKELDKVSLYEYLQLNYIPAPATILKNIYKLEPGHTLTVKKKEVKKEKFYEVAYQSHKPVYNPLSYEQQQAKLVELMDEAVRLRLVSDVPLGAFLSGGIDSSVVVALASRYVTGLNTFSIGFRDEPFFDETQYAELVAKKYATNHTVFSLTSNDLLDIVFDVLNYQDEPFADSSALAVHILSKHTASKVKVALSGDGADELFAGYNKHFGEFRVREGGFMVELISALGPLWNILPKSRNSFLSNKVRQLSRLSEGRKLDHKSRYWRWASFATEQDALSLLSSESRQGLEEQLYKGRKDHLLRHITPAGDLNQALRTDVEMLLPNDMLHKVDMMSMANSLEVRVPFLDHRVVDFAFSLPVSSKIDGSMKKKILQDAFREMLPKELYRRPKQGFEVPMLKWLRKDLKSLINDDLLNDEFVREQKIFDVAQVSALKKKLWSQNPEDAHARIWGLLVFQYWWKKYLKS